MWGRQVRKILIVTDGAASPGLCPMFLQRRDIRVKRIEADADVAERVRRERPSLTILDIPVDDPGRGLDACRRVKSASASSPPLIVVDEPGRRRDAEAAGADVVLSRPIVQRQYFDAVRRFVRLPRRRDPRHLINLRFTYETATHEGQAFSRDLSLYGAFLKTDRVVEIGTQVKICFSLPGDPEPITCVAVVRHATRPSPDTHQTAGFAIEFEAVDGDDFTRLDLYIKRHERPTFLERFGA